MPIRRRRNVQGDILLKQTITLNDAQIKSLPTGAPEAYPIIVPAPGAGKIIIPFFSTWILNTTAIYTNLQSSTNPSGCGIYLVWDALNNYNNASGSILGSGFLDHGPGQNVSYLGHISANLSQIGIFGGTLPYAEVGNAGETGFGYENVPLFVGGQNDTPSNLGNFTGGNAANTLKVTVWYDILTI